MHPSWVNTYWCSVFAMLHVYCQPCVSKEVVQGFAVGCTAIRRRCHKEVKQHPHSLSVMSVPWADPVCLHLHKWSEHHQCILSASSVAWGVAVDLCCWHFHLVCHAADSRVEQTLLQFKRESKEEITKMVQQTGKRQNYWAKFCVDCSVQYCSCLRCSWAPQEVCRDCCQRCLQAAQVHPDTITHCTWSWESPAGFLAAMRARAGPCSAGWHAWYTRIGSSSSITEATNGGLSGWWQVRGASTEACCQIIHRFAHRVIAKFLHEWFAHRSMLLESV